MAANIDTGRYILLATPEVPLGAKLCTALESAGFKVVTATDGHEAIRMAQEMEEIVIMILDTNMPGLNGYLASRLIRQSGNAEMVIILMAWFSVQSMEMGYAVGCNEIVAKPVDVEKLLRVVAKWTKEETLPEGAGLKNIIQNPINKLK